MIETSDFNECENLTTDPISENRDTYTILTHNCSGYKPTYHKPLLRDDTIDFVLLQETFHFESSKFIYDDNQKFKTFQASAMDENEQNKKWQGGSRYICKQPYL